MNSILRYKGYSGTVEYSADDNIFFGKVIGVGSLISYEGQNRNELRINFKAAVDEYLILCDENKNEL